SLSKIQRLRRNLLVGCFSQSGGNEVLVGRDPTFAARHRLRRCALGGRIWHLAKRQILGKAAWRAQRPSNHRALVAGNPLCASTLPVASFEPSGGSREAPRTRSCSSASGGAPFTVAGVQKLVARAGEAAAFDFQVHPHQLRHACGFVLANQRYEVLASVPGSSLDQAYRSVHRTEPRSVQEILDGLTIEDVVDTSELMPGGGATRHAQAIGPMIPGTTT